MSEQDEGRDFEKEWAAKVDGEAVPGSGANWYRKMDVADGTILWSGKWTKHKSFSLTKELMQEVQRAITGPGGIGGDAIPAIVTKIDGWGLPETFVTLRAEDFLRMVSENVKYVTPSKGEQKRATAKIPALLRETDG